MSGIKMNHSEINRFPILDEKWRDQIAQNLKMENDPILKDAIVKAFEMLYLNDHYLIWHESVIPETDHVSEIAITFRFTHYLQTFLERCSDYRNCVVDCEYNRMG